MNEQFRVPLVEAARLLRIGYYKAHHLVLTGALPSERVGSRWYTDKRAVERLARERAAAKTSTEAQG